MIVLNKFSVAFDENIALNSASVEIKSGERLGIVGESGSGKTMPVSYTHLTLPTSDLV